MTDDKLVEAVARAIEQRWVDRWNAFGGGLKIECQRDLALAAIAAVRRHMMDNGK